MLQSPAYGRERRSNVRNEVELPPRPSLKKALLGAALLLAAWATSAPALAQALKTTSPHVFLMDQGTGTILYSKGADDAVAPASTAKIMTAELTFHLIALGKLHLTDVFKVSENAWRTGGAPARASSMFAAVNSSISVQDLIRGLIVPSGNDAAIVLAEGIAGSEANFAKMMTARARELGLDGLTFTSVWGKDAPDQCVTARGMAQLASDIIRAYPDFYKFFGQKDFIWNRVHQFNRDPLLSMNIGADGLMTGYIKGDGYGLVGSAIQNGQRLVLAIYGADSAKERAEEARKVFEWGFRTFQTKVLFKPGETVGYASVFQGSREYVPLVASGPLNVLTPRSGGEPLTGHIVYKGPVPAPIAQGAQIARLQVKRGDTLILDAPLQAAEAVPVGGLPRRAMDSGIELGVGMFRKYVLKQ